MPLIYREDPERKTVELKVRGSLSQEDYGEVMGPMAEFIQRHGSVRILEVVESFAGFEGDIAVPAGPETDALMSRITHVALVSDIGWICPMLSGATASTRMKIQSFELKDLDKARDWLGKAIYAPFPSEKHSEG